MNHTDYYVYAHRDLNGVIFYIGKGRVSRAYMKDNRSRAWNEKSRDGHAVELLAENLTNDEALKEEQGYLNNPKEDWKLVNVSKTNKWNKMNADFLASKVYYDETSPTYLRWKETRYSAPSGIKIPITYAGSVAGVQSEDPKRYSVVRIEGCNYSVHRVIYVLMVGEIPDRHVVNHIDGNIKNNRISNLEVCTQTENCRRKKLHNGSLMKNNTSGVNGVSFDKESNSWNAYWYENYKLKKKRFYIHKLGETEAFRLACEYRKQMIEKLNSEGAGYSIAE